MSGPLRVLIVDDSKDGADSLSAVIRMMGGEAQVAYDGPSALETMKTFRPAVVLLDLSMPGMDGFEVAKRTRADPELPQPRLIALTGWGTEEEQQRTRDLGFNDHWVKPVAPEKLVALMQAPPAEGGG